MAERILLPLRACTPARGPRPLLLTRQLAPCMCTHMSLCMPLPTLLLTPPFPPSGRRKDDPDSFQLRPQLSYYPQFMFNFRRSQFIQVDARYACCGMPHRAALCCAVLSLCECTQGVLLGRVSLQILYWSWGPWGGRGSSRRTRSQQQCC